LRFGFFNIRLQPASGTGFQLLRQTWSNLQITEPPRNKAPNNKSSAPRKSPPRSTTPSTTRNPLAERVLQMLQEAGNRGMALAAIYKGLSGHATNEELHPALKDLHNQGLARSEKVKTSGRPGQVWFAMKAARERSDQIASKLLEPQPSDAPAEEVLSSLNSLKSPEGQWEEVL
jgi:hypothetical protein